jgi:hypothetical protein
MTFVPARNFTARGVPVTLLRIRTKAEFTAPGWTRLQRHIEKQEKAGWTVSVRRRRLPNPIEVEGYSCVELADVDLCEPLV